MSPDGSAQTIRSLQAQKASAARWDPPNKHEIARDYAAAKLEACIRRVVETAPPLTPTQRDKLALLLRVGGGGDA